MKGSNHKDWSELFKRYEGRGLSRVAFCKRENISFQQFKYRWYRQYSHPLNKEEERASEEVAPFFEPIKFTVQEQVSDNKKALLSLYVNNSIRCEVKVDVNPDELGVLLRRLVSCS